mmetsp:Transcript_46132/g.78503  ORF Transcript_46132/g.78503 Transcript_46132/m.78503 type:complete len:189 (+) Transcript_46132:350-916(+)
MSSRRARGLLFSKWTSKVQSLTCLRDLEGSTSGNMSTVSWQRSTISLEGNLILMMVRSLVMKVVKTFSALALVRQAAVLLAISTRQLRFLKGAEPSLIGFYDIVQDFLMFSGRDLQQHVDTPRPPPHLITGLCLRLGLLRVSAAEGGISLFVISTSKGLIRESVLQCCVYSTANIQEIPVGNTGEIFR